jgi:hypothetical protein
VQENIFEEKKLPMPLDARAICDSIFAVNSSVPLVGELEECPCKTLTKDYRLLLKCPKYNKINTLGWCTRIFCGSKGWSFVPWTASHAGMRQVITPPRELDRELFQSESGCHERLKQRLELY